MNKAEQYVNDVLSGVVIAPKYIIQACEKYRDERKNLKDFVFDETKAQAYIDFIQLLCFTKGKWAGKPFILENWQAFLCWNLFGWRTLDGKYRRYREATLHIPKKNGKTEIGAAIAVVCALLDNDYGGEIYMAATSRNQAGICFKAAKDMIKLSPHVKPYYELLAHSIYVEKTGSAIKAISAEAGGIEGAGSSVVIFDEEHEQRTNELRDNLITGMAARSQPLFVSISTAGNDRNKPYFKHIERCKKVLNGIIKEDRHFIMLYAADELDKWDDEITWKKVNPNYGLSVTTEYMVNQFTKVQNTPSDQPAFKTKHLNIYTDTYNTWIAHELWMKGKRQVKLEDYIGCECYCGLDLASRYDFTALSLLFPNNDGTFTLFTKFWIPEEMAQTRTNKDKINFINWANEGHIKLTEGNVTDYDVVQRDIEYIHNNFQIKSIAYDPHNSSQLVNNLVNYGVNMTEFSQSMMTMSSPTKEFEKLVMETKILHDGNPVLAWMLGNVLIYIDPNLNKKINRGKSTDKVDGVISSVMALGMHMENKEEDYFFCV